jgi:hypothetical protein
LIRRVQTTKEDAMPDPRTSPRERDKPAFQPGTPTPEDPRQNEPIHDPPVNPEHDDGERPTPTRQAEDATNPIVFDESRPVG